MQKSFLTKTAKVASIASLFVFSGIIIFALQTASGWSNPTSNPPTAPGAISYSNGNVGIGTSNPTSTLSVSGVISAMGNKIVDVDDPTAGKDAVNLDTLQRVISAAGAGSGGSVVLFYKEVNNAPSAPACPTGFTPYGNPGYGPHYVSMFAYDYLYNDAQGNQNEGGFGGSAPLGTPPPGNNSAYTLKSVGFGSDSVCSTDQKSIVPVTGFYGNTVSTTFAGLYADACGQYNGVTHCNRCIICSQ